MGHVLVRAVDENNNPISFTFPKLEWEHIAEFKRKYKLEREFDTSQKEILGRKNKTENRICRFCKMEKPDTTFTKEAHVVSEQFGRSKIISHYECDNCNDAFSIFESDLSHFLLLDKALIGQKNKSNKFPVFKSSKSRIQQVILDPNKPIDANILLENPNLKDGIRIIQVINESSENSVEFSDDSIKIDEFKPPYYPINVFKAFLKIGLSLVHENELGRFSIIMDWLMNPIDEKFNCLLFANQMVIPIIANIYQNPVVYLYQSKESTINYVEKTMVLCFGHMFFQIHLYSDDNLEKLSRQEDLRFTLTNPFVEPYDEALFLDDRIKNAFLNYSVDKHDLSSKIIKRDDKEVRTITWHGE